MKATGSYAVVTNAKLDVTTSLSCPFISFSPFQKMLKKKKTYRTLLSETLIKQLLEFSASIPDNLEPESESDSCRMNVTSTLIAFACVSLGPITSSYIQTCHNKAGRTVCLSVNCSNSDAE